MKRFLVLCAALFTAIGCNDSTGPGSVASITVNFPTAPIPVGSTLQLTPAALDKIGLPVTAECVFTYTSSDQTVATVSSSGLITGVAEGTATITVETLGKTISSIITVGNAGGSVSAITLVPSSVTIAQGKSGQIYAILTDGDGNVIPQATALAPTYGRTAKLTAGARQTNAPVAVQWASDAPNVATVNSTGVVNAVSEGRATITVIAGGKTATATVNVVPSANAVANIRIVPPTVVLGINSATPLNAIVTDADGLVLSGRTLTWTTNAPGIAKVDAATGLVTGVAAGTATISVISEGKTATATVIVSPTGQGSVAFNQSAISLSVGGTADVSVTVRDAAGNPVASPTVNFTTTPTTVATVVGNGSSATVTGVTAGTATLRAITNGLSAELGVTVTAVPVVSVVITPANPRVAVNQTLQLTATARDAGNNPIPGRTATWASSNENVAIVSSAGVVLGKTVGTTNITATIDDVPHTVALTVTAPVVTSIEFNPTGPISLAVGQSVDVRVTLRDGTGNALTGITVAFASRDVAKATTTSNNDLLLPGGRITGVSVGSAYVTATATSGGVTKVDSIRVNVSLVPAAQLNVPNPLVCVPLGGTLQLVGTVLDAAGNVLTGRPISWSVTTPGNGSITSNGLLTGLTSGVTNVLATVEGVTKTVAVTVCPATVERVTLTPSTSTVSVLGSKQLTATTYDGLNNVLAGRTVTYSSSNPTVATVNATGLVTGVTAGNVTITATSEGKTGTAAVTVSNAPVASLASSPSSVSMTMTGGTRQLDITTFDGAGNVLTDRTVTFVSGDPAVVTVSPAGVLTPVGLGNTTVTASSEGRSVQIPVSVVNAPVETVELIGPSLIVKLLWGSSSESYSVVTKDAGGNVLTGRSCTWASNNPNVLNVNLGQATALGLGTATLTVTCEGKSASKNVSVVSVLSF